MKLLDPVLIRGMSCELGQTLARALVAEGCRVLGICRSEESRTRLQEAGFEAVCAEAPEVLPALLAGTVFHAPKAFVDCAHSQTESLVAALDPEQIDRWSLEDIAARARYLRTVVRLMLPGREGRCLFISSAALAAPARGQGYYAAAKAAGEALYASVGLEMAGRGITTCSLRLGWMDAGRGHAYLRNRTGLAGLVPTGHLVSLEEACGGLLYLLSQGARSINATVVTMDGGFSQTKPEAPQDRTAAL